MFFLKTKPIHLFLQAILLCVLIVFAMLVRVVSGQQDQKTQLIQALKDLQDTIVARMDADVETITITFTDAEDVRRSRKWAVAFDVPLTIIEETIGAVKSLVSTLFAPDQVIQMLNESNKLTELVSAYMTTSSLVEAGESLQLAIDGPNYISQVKQMIETANAYSTLSRFDKEGYATTIKAYVYGTEGKGLLVVPRKSTDVTRKNVSVANSVKSVRRAVSQEFSELIQQLSEAQLPPDFPFQPLLQKIEVLIKQVKQSGLSATDVTYETHLKRGEQAQPVKVNLKLGALAELEKVRRAVLEQFTRDVRLEQISTVVGAATSAVDAASLYLSVKYRNPKTQEIVGTIDQVTFGVSLGNFTVSKTFETTAEEQVSMIPQEMLLSLSNELSHLWMIADDGIYDLKYQMEMNALSGSKVQVKLKDGSVFTGSILEKTLKVRLSFGSVDLKTSEIIQIGDSQGTPSSGILIRLKDGSSLQGDILIPTFDLKTNFGVVPIRVEDILRAVEKPPAQPIGELSRDVAASIISNTKGLPRPIYYFLPVARVSEGGINLLGPPWQDYLKAWSQLESLGYITLQRLGKIESGGFLNIPWDTVEISLTDKGKEIFTHDQEHFWRAKICEKVLVGVTGISVNEGKITALVEYIWRYGNFSPIFQAVLPISDLRDSSVYSLHKEEEMMRKYDDGWRVVD
jgi:hypothetical protein